MLQIYFFLNFKFRNQEIQSVLYKSNKNGPNELKFLSLLSLSLLECLSLNFEYRRFIRLSLDYHCN